MAHARGYLSTLAALVGGVTLAVSAFAQAPKQVQVVRFTVFAAKTVDDLAFIPRANAEPQKLTFQATARSPRYEYRGPMPLRFFDASSSAVVAEATIPAGIQDALLLFTPIATPAKSGAAQPALRYQVAVLDDGAARHAPGGLAILNLSGTELGGTINKQPVTVKTGLNPTLPVTRTASVALTTVSKKRTYQAYTGTVTLARNERALLVLFPPYYKGSHEVQSRLLIDQPPGVGAPPPPAAKAPNKR